MAEREFKGIWIPKEIWLNTKLTLQEKVFLVEIGSLDGKDGCYASNDHFSNFFNLSKNRCSEIITSLSKKGYISIDYIYKEGTKQIEKRIIHISKIKYFGIRDVDKGIRNSEEGIRDIDRGYSEKCEDNNTVINNTNYILLSLYEELGFGTINSISKSDIEIMSKEYSAKWVEEAMKEANDSGVRNLKYVKGILKNWKTKGFKAEKGGKGNGSTTKPTKNTESEGPKYNFDSLYGK